MLKDCIAHDGRLTFTKTAEGARADFSVCFPGGEDRAIGCQLKTTHSLNNITGKDYFNFCKTDKYEGMMVILVAFVGPRARVWMRPGSTISAVGLHIPVEPSNGYDWGVHAVDLDDVAQALITSYLIDDIKPAPVADWMVPVSFLQQREYREQLRLEKLLPLNFVPPDVEHRHYDYTVSGARWQTKVAGRAAGDYFCCHLKTKAGTVDGRRRYQQYSADAFDFLAILLPADHVQLRAVTPRMWLVPMRVLLERRLANRTDVTGATLCLYPHRQAHPRTQWLDAFMIDLTSHASALAGHSRIVESERTFATSMEK